MIASDQREQWIQFLNESYEYQPPQSYHVDFAPLFEENQLKHAELLEVDGQIISSATIFPTTIKTYKNNFHLGILSAIATHRQFQNQGHASFLIQKMEARAQKQNMDALVLWSDQARFYQNLGYQAYGIQGLVDIRNLRHLLKPHENGHLEEGWEMDSVMPIYEQHALRVVRDPNYWKNLQKITSCSRVQWRNNQGIVTAYLGFHRGKDLRNIIHEWGGNASDLLSLLSAALQKYPELQWWLTHPALNDPLNSFTETHSYSKISTLGWIKILNNNSLITQQLKNIWFWGLDSY